jgi:parallel beta-helix repeat protein
MEGTDASVGGEGGEYFRNAGPGIRVNAVPQRITDAMVWGNRDNANGTTKGYGILVESASRFSISRCKIEQNRGGIELQAASSVRIQGNSFASNSVSTGLGTAGEDGWTIPAWSSAGAENQTSDIRFNSSGGVPTNVLVTDNAFGDAYTPDTSKYHFEILTGTGGVIRDNLIPSGQAATAAFNTLTPANTWSIEDGSGITDSGVSASAAIAESKLALASDAAAGTASRRTLGTGAAQAAAGNHRHSSPADLGSGTPSSGKYLDGGGSWLTMGATPNGSGEYINIQRAPYSASSNSDITTVLQQLATDINAGSQPTYTVRIPGRGYTNTALIDFTKTVKWQGDGPGMTDLQMSGSAAEIRFRGSIGSAVPLTANVLNNAITLSFPTTGFAERRHHRHPRHAGVAVEHRRRREQQPRRAAGDRVHRLGVAGHAEDADDQRLQLRQPRRRPGEWPRRERQEGHADRDAVDRGHEDLDAVRAAHHGREHRRRPVPLREGRVARQRALRGLRPVRVGVGHLLRRLRDNTDIEDGYWDTASGRWSYGHLMRGPTRNVIISNSRSRNAQLVNGGGDSNGGPRAIQVNNCVMTGAQKDLFGADGWKPMLSTHGDNMAWQFNNILIDGGRYGGSVDTAVEVKGSDHVYNNVAVRNVTTTGVFCTPQSSRLRFNARTSPTSTGRG